MLSRKLVVGDAVRDNSAQYVFLVIEDVMFFGSRRLHFWFRGESVDGSYSYCLWFGEEYVMNNPDGHWEIITDANQDA